MADEARGQMAVPKDAKPLTRDDILNITDRVEEEVYVPEWKGKLKIHSLTVAEREQARRAAQVIGPSGDLDIDEETMQLSLFVLGTDIGLTLKDMPVLKKKLSGVIQKIALRVIALSGMSRESLGNL